ncbi:hypothetical protein Dimus_005273 [Dionaea muscipula]
MGAFSSTILVSRTISSCPFISFLPLVLRQPPTFSLSHRTFACCNCSVSSLDSLDISTYHRDAFGKRMAMAGLKPHHRIALGVSGGPDSMALCVLAADWKASGSGNDRDGGRFLDGLLAIIVDHGLRAESKAEATLVSDRVSNMGIRYEIASCDWSDGRPKQGHLQEAARDMRYEIFIDTCIRHKIGALLIAHHSDDQAELFVLRLSRNSGVLGLAGMAFSSQLFPKFPLSLGESSSITGIVLVRPLLEFSKEDLYKICKDNNQKWVEDPSNKSALFARNRIRMELSKVSSIFKSELQALISDCRRTRSYVDSVCRDLINKSVTVMDHGYAIVDVKILDPSSIEDVCLLKFLASILQFISQRHRQVRGSVSKLLLGYIRTFPCKTSLTAAGCYLCAAPGSKGTKIIVCSYYQSDLPLKLEWLPHHFDKGWYSIQDEVEDILAQGKLYRSVPDAFDVRFLDVSSSKSVLDEAKKLKILGDSTCSNIIEMQMKETARFRTKATVLSDIEEKHDEKAVDIAPPCRPLRPSQSCYFMNRFLITWQPSKKSIGLGHANCSIFANEHEMVADIRLMVDDDWLYLANLAKDEVSSIHQYQEFLVGSEKIKSDYRVLSAQKALFSLSSIPAAARRGLPVLVSQHGLLLSIPSIGFKQCPCLVVSVVFKPRVPLGGGHSSFL